MIREITILLAALAVISSGCGTKEHAPSTDDIIRGAPDSMSAAPAQSYGVHGLVKTVMPNRKHIVVAHGDIPGFMAAMTMPFAVEDTSVVAGVLPGDSVSFTLVVDGPRIFISSLGVIQ